MRIPMHARISRRDFVRLAAVLAIPRRFDGLPRVDGTFDVDPKAREALAVDVGRNVRRVPLAVLKPGSIADVTNLVRYCNSRSMKVAMRGQAHSQYGQTLVENGIVIDSSTLSSISFVGDTAVDVGAGATWGAITQATLPSGLTPPVMPDTMLLSAGGILSVGGWGNTSHRYGAVVDNVTQLDVVTGDGRLVTCSASRDRELFQATLAGLGQCGLIVRARLRLVKAPTAVVLEQLDYNDLKTFVAAVTQFAVEGRFDHLEPRIVRNDNGGWTFRIMAGRFEYSGERSRAARLSRAGASATAVSYREYLARTEPELAALRAARQGGPQRSGSVTIFIPASATPDFVAQTLASPAETAGLWRFGCAPMIRKRYAQPLFKLPEAQTVFGLWLFRAVPADDAAAGATMDDGSRSLFARMRAVGGKFYVPYSGFPSRKTWRQHFGTAWNRFAAAKRRFDPAGVLTPGPGIF
jgi:cytokinin dehydrogenase